jgi:hypothetical protein
LAWDQDGRLVLPFPSGWFTLDPDNGSHHRYTSVGQPAEHIVCNGRQLAIVDSEGILHRMQMGADGDAVRLHTVRTGPVRLLSLSPSGESVVWIDAHGNLHAPGKVSPSPNPAMIRGLAAGEESVAVVGGRTPLLRIYDSTTWMAIDRPWDAVPVDVVAVGRMFLILTGDHLTLIGPNRAIAHRPPPS